MKASQMEKFSELTKWMVEAHDLTRVYGDGESIRALDGIDLLIGPGELVAS
jgi:hypothetical protein